MYEFVLIYLRNKTNDMHLSKKNYFIPLAREMNRVIGKSPAHHKLFWHVGNEKGINFPMMNYALNVRKHILQTSERKKTASVKFIV